MTDEYDEGDRQYAARKEQDAHDYFDNQKLGEKLEGFVFEQAVEKRGNIDTGETYWVTADEDASEMVGITDADVRDAPWTRL